MYRNAVYFKTRGVEQLDVLFYDSKPKEAEMKFPFMRISAHLSAFEPISYSIRPCSGVTAAVMMDELYRLWNFLQEKNWRGRAKDYDLIVGGRL